MNNRIVRIILFIVTALFIAGITWAIITIARRNNNETAETPTNPTEQQSPTYPVVGLPSPPFATSSEVAEQAPTLPAPRRQRAIAEEEVIFEAGAEASAWAISGVNPDGSTYAEAHAE